MIAQSGPKTAIKISNHYFVGDIYSIAKILFTSKVNTKKSQMISNLFLASRALRGEPQNQWAALCAAQKMVSQKSESLVLVYLYNSARTHFIKNS